MSIKLTKLLLQEAKQVGKLYHFTSFDNYEQIEKKDTLRAPYANKLISTTRDKNFGYRVKNAPFKHSIKTDVRITLDGDKLSHKYRIQPLGFFGATANYNFKDIREVFKLNTLEEYKEFYDEFAPMFRIPEGREKDKLYDSDELVNPSYLSVTERIEISRRLGEYLKRKGVKVIVGEIYDPIYKEHVPYYYAEVRKNETTTSKTEIFGATFDLFYHFDRNGKYIYAADLRSKDEMEELIAVPKNEIVPISDYILNVEFYDEDTNRYIEM